MSSSPKLLQHPDLCSPKLNSRSFPFPLSQLYLGFMLFILLDSAHASSAYDEWFLSCKDPLICSSIPAKEFPLRRNNGTEFCSFYYEIMKLNCDGDHATIQIVGETYELVGFSINNQIVIIAEIDFSDRFCSPEKYIWSSSMYAIIPVSVCENPRTVDKPTCSGTEFGNLPRSNLNEYCWISLVVPISQWLLKQVGDDLQKISQHIIAEFKSGQKVDGEVCRNCSVPGGVYVYDLQLNQTRCCCQSSFSSGFELCPSSSGSATPQPSPSGSGSQHANVRRKLAVVGAISLAGVILIISIIIFIYKKKRISTKDDIEEIVRRYCTQTPKRYSYSKLKKITNSFKNKLGQGGFSTVYKGKLPSGCDVAVKLLNESRQGNGQDFINEVVSIAKTSHINIVMLLGFCYEHNKRALVYEYMPKGSLDKYISHNKLQKEDMKFNWNTLYNVVIGVARGLEYLHRGCITRILHFDIKPHNILLDDDFCPKISDFGLAKQCRAKESHVSITGVKGTAGFIAPEVIFRNFGKVSHKSDVYSYGMLVLEMVGARKNPNDGVEQRSEDYFPVWIYKDLTQSKINGVCWRGNTEEEEEMARKMIIVGLHCIQTLPDDRPSMTDVVAMLEGSVDGLQIPPKPNLFVPPSTDLLQAAAAASSSLNSY